MSSEHFSILEIRGGIIYFYKLPYPTSGLEVFERSGELEVIEDILDNSDGDIIFDIGANVGLYSIIIGLSAQKTDYSRLNPTPKLYLN
jgi:hypothetical protein